MTIMTLKKPWSTLVTSPPNPLSKLKRVKGSDLMNFSQGSENKKPRLWPGFLYLGF